jgi:signal transduction histidine kinase
MTITLDERSLAILAHELRHPLAPLRSAVELIRRLNVQEPQLTRAYQILDRQTRWLTQLVDGLFDLARLNTTPITLHREQLDLAELVEQALEVSRPLLEQNHHWVTVTLPETPVLIEGDRLRLIQVLANLLNNAARYTEAGGIIDVEVRQTEAEIQVSIRDNGQGIAADLLPRLFEPFVQGDSPHQRGVAGLGIGLTVVKTLVEWHQGRIEAWSGGVGQGAEFSVHLPRCSLVTPD